MKFSIIIPVFNLDTYISDCLDSLINQDIDPNEYEILIINDGSTDNTEFTVSQYCKKHTNILLLSQENSGVSHARNVGINKAMGEYILFVDGDDRLNPNVLNEIYTNFKSSDLEVMRFGYVNSNESMNLHQKVYIQNSPKKIDGIEFLIESKTLEFFPWLYSFSREFINNNNLKFNTNLSFCEDKEFVIRALSLTNKFKNYSFIVYHYNTGRQGAVTTKISPKKTKNIIESNLLIYNYAINNIDNVIYREYIKEEALNSIKKSYYILSTYSLFKEFRNWIKIVKSIPEIKLIKTKPLDKLFILNFNSFIFYIIYYLPRALYHKRNNFFKHG